MGLDREIDDRVRLSRVVAELCLERVSAGGDAAPIARAHLEQSVGLLEQLKAENELSPLPRRMAASRGGGGCITEARDDLTRALAIFERGGTSIELYKFRSA